jgi:endonuclease III
MSIYGLDNMLRWKNPDKLIRIQEMAQMMLNEGVETEDDLSHWIAVNSNCFALQNIKGVGAKTVDYIKILVGISEIAVDRHIRNYAQCAGISAHKYSELKRTFQFAANLLEINCSVFDKLIWEHMSGRSLN